MNDLGRGYATGDGVVQDTDRAGSALYNEAAEADSRWRPDNLASGS